MDTQLRLFEPPHDHDPKQSDQWYTPDWCFQLVEEALGYIDLDPTADPMRRSPATFHITEAEDCFSFDWHVQDDEEGFYFEPKRIYMNPPYSKPKPFLERLCQYLTEHPEACAITLTKEGTLFNQGTQDYFRLNARAICLHQGRINFLNPCKKGDGVNFDVVWAYLGNPVRLEQFKQVFKYRGLLMEVA